MPPRPSSRESAHWHTFRGVRALKSTHPEVRRLKRREESPSLHGNKVWHSSFALIDYLHRHPPTVGARVIDVDAQEKQSGTGKSGAKNDDKHEKIRLDFDSDNKKRK